MLEMTMEHKAWSTSVSKPVDKSALIFCSNRSKIIKSSSFCQKTITQQLENLLMAME